MQKAELGTRIANETAASLAEIVSGIGNSTQIASEIAESSKEQATGITQINNGIEQVAMAVQQNSDTAEESAAAAEELSGQSDLMKQLVAQFKLKDNAGYKSKLPPYQTALGNSLPITETVAFAINRNTGDPEKY